MLFLPKKIRILFSKLLKSISVNKYNRLYRNFFNINNFGDKVHKFANILLLDNHNQIYFELLDNFYNNDLSKNRSYDIKDFDLSFIRGLSLEDGAATLTDYTAKILSEKIINPILSLFFMAANAIIDATSAAISFLNF